MPPVADPQVVSTTDHCGALFRAPYGSWKPDQLLRHFQTRMTVQYFPVVDAVETAREKIENILNDRFEFNQESHTIPSPIRWTENPSRDREWLILLHKFYYSVGLGMAYHETSTPRYVKKWMELTSSWINAVPLDFLPSDVAGRRIQNWIFAHYYFVTLHQSAEVGPEFYAQFLESLHRQVSHLCEHLTPARNHRTLELCAIFSAAVVFPEFNEAENWLTFSTEELSNNIQADFLPDGVHCELSTDYHHLVLKNYLWIRKLARLNDISMPDSIDEGIKKALEFSVYSHRPDGAIPSLSDGDSRNFLDLLKQGYELYGHEPFKYVSSQGKSGTPPEHRSRGFVDSGYYVLRSGWSGKNESYQDQRYLIFDCGPLGAGNHGHLDVLSFEMAAYGRPLIVDPGRYTYDESGETNWRALFRGTAYHNTVLVDGRNQTRYEWKKNRFKVTGSEPEREIRAFVTRPGLDYLHGVARSHEYPVVHERKILFVNGEYWVIVDLLRATGSHEYDLLFHLSSLAQDRVLVMVSDNTISIHSPQLILAQPFNPNVSLSIQKGFVSVSYGEKCSAPIVRMTQRESSACFLTVVYPYKEDEPNVSIEMQEPSMGPQALLLGELAQVRVTVTRNGEQYRDDLLFTDQSLSHAGTPNAPSPSRARVSRWDNNGRLLFQHEA
jgi:hypothetical protein